PAVATRLLDSDVPPARGSRIAPAYFKNGATPSRTKRRTAPSESTGQPNLPAARRCVMHDAEQWLDFVAVPSPDAVCTAFPQPPGHNCVCGAAQTDLAHAASNCIERGAGLLVCSPKKIATDRLSLSLRQYI